MHCLGMSTRYSFVSRYSFTVFVLVPKLLNISVKKNKRKQFSVRVFLLDVQQLYLMRSVQNIS